MQSPAEDDADWMRLALDLAERAQRSGEAPVGAVVRRQGLLIGSGHNAPVADCDPTAHAEIVALRAAAVRCGNYRLTGSVVYVTIEPCAMCASALVHARVSRVVFGARESRAGAVVSQMRFFEQPWLNHRVAWSEGVLAEQCAERMREFFQQRRAAARSARSAERAQ